MTTSQSRTTTDQLNRAHTSPCRREELTRRLVEAVASNPESTAEALLRDAMRESASDIHIDPQPSGFRIRFRIDGIVHDGALLALQEGQRLVNQVKAMAAIDPVTTFLPEEARIKRKIDGRSLDLRVTLVPCLDGPKFSLRVLERERIEQRMDGLGLSERDLQRVQNWLSTLTGMFIVTGPTGVGKTTTLYALLHEMNLMERSIVTLEDPVEYSIEGINQIQIDEEQGLSFPTGIKSALHLDPDYLLVGEMRDAVSAHAALGVATSGRTVLTTLHSRDAVGAITAMRNFDLADHEIAAAASMIVAQRLVRRLCPACRRMEDPSDVNRRWLEAMGLDIPEQVWQPTGCDECDQVGYRGRIGVFEAWSLDDADRQLVASHADALSIRNHLAEAQHRFLLDEAMTKVEQGVTSLDELRMPGNAAIPAPRAG